MGSLYSGHFNLLREFGGFFFLSFSSLANNESSYLALDDSVRITCFCEGKPTLQITHCLKLQCTDRRWLSMALESETLMISISTTHDELAEIRQSA